MELITHVQYLVSNIYRNSVSNDKLLDAAEREEILKAKEVSLEDLSNGFSSLIKAFKLCKDGDKQEYNTKLLAYTLVYELLFGFKIPKIQEWVIKFILRQLPGHQVIYTMLEQAFSRFDTGSDASASEDNHPIMDALYSVFLVSRLDDEAVMSGAKSSERGNDMRNLFGSYAVDYMLVSIHSPIVRDIHHLQECSKRVETNKFGQRLIEKYKKNYFYHEASRSKYLLENEFKNMSRDFTLNLWKSDKVTT